jgi:hypothetical protein
VCVYSVFFVVLCVGSGLAFADHWSKESYHLCKKYYETEEEARAQQSAVKPLLNESTKMHLNFTSRRLKLICCDNYRWSITRSNLVIDTSSVNITRTVLDESTNCEALLYVIISISLLFNHF